MELEVESTEYIDFPEPPSTVKILKYLPPNSLIRILYRKPGLNNSTSIKHVVLKKPISAFVFDPLESSKLQVKVRVVDLDSYSPSGRGYMLFESRKLELEDELGNPFIFVGVEITKYKQ